MRTMTIDQSSESSSSLLNNSKKLDEDTQNAMMNMMIQVDIIDPLINGI
jgi:hypothetical protein